MAGTWKSPLWKGKSSSKPPFWGSMLVFGCVYLSYDRWCLFFLKARLNRLVKGVPQGYGLYLVINRKVCCMDRIYYIYICYIYDICIYMYWMYMDIIWYHAYFCSTVLFLSRTRRFTCIYLYTYLIDIIPDPLGLTVSSECYTIYFSGGIPDP